MGFWKENEYNSPEEKTKQFFEQFKKNKRDLDTTLKGITYRKEQESYAISIMKAIRDKQILLIEAGVGIGKSFGYLIPVFYTQNDVNNFKKVIISTPSIALQQQLLKEAKKVSEMLGINLEVSIAKGVNNYACLRRIREQETKTNLSSEERQTLEHLEKEMLHLSSSDKEELQEVSNTIWEKVKLTSRGKCSNCNYSRRCPYFKNQKKWLHSNLIITNQANFIKDFLEDGDITRNADMFIFDEAHQLENNMRTVRERTLELNDIKKTINQIYTVIGTFYSDNMVISRNDETKEEDYINQLKKDIEQLFSSIRSSSSRNFTINNKKNQSITAITDCERVSFTYNKTIMAYLDKIIINLKKLYSDIHDYERKYQTTLRLKEIEKLNIITNIFLDMKKNNPKQKNYGSKNIYWVDFFQTNKITLHYTPKRNFDITKGMLNRQIPIVYTSGTLLDNKDSYKYFMEGIDLEGDKSQSITLGASYPSPYNYKKNTLFYCNPNISVPNNYNQYIVDLAYEINRLIRTTDGKALVLFTSKKCMNDTYNLLLEEGYDFPILLQNNTNTNEVKQQFQENQNSCLFATGAFWEGIDIKGKSLSNLIITHLPFDVVEPVIQYKASKYADDLEKFNEVYIPSMLTKFTQAAGRLIRDSKDVGIISCLDSRFPKYRELIENKTGMTNYTENINDVIQFAEEKILPKKRTPKKVKNL